MMMEKEEVPEYKLVLIGNAGVGKTSIIYRMIKKVFNETNPPTVGAMFLTYNLEIDGKNHRLQIWDTAGQEKLRSIAPLYYRDAHGVVLVYDTTNKSTFEGLEQWFNDLKDKAPERIQTIILGNKIDLTARQKVDFETATKFAETQKSSLELVSAKDGRGIEAAFANLVKKIIHMASTAPPPAENDSESVFIRRKTFAQSENNKKLFTPKTGLEKKGHGRKDEGCC